MQSQYIRLALLGQLLGWALANVAKTPSITPLETGEGVHAVQVAQTFFGTPGTCEEGPKNQASIFFATHLDPNTLELTCGIFQRDVGACFKKNILIGCDPDTNTAKIDLYVRDESLSRLQKTDNPKVGRCKAGSMNYITRAIKVTETFPCTPSGPEEVTGPEEITGPGTCSDAHDDCGDGTFCASSPELGHFCKEYVSLGGQCEEEGLELCNASEAYCLQADCLDADAPRICKAYGGVCSADSDCINDEYCSKTENKCRAKLNEGDCCDRSQNQCNGGFCNFKTSLDGKDIFTCKSYVPVGSGCGAFQIRGSENRCDPNEAYCYKPMDCVIADYGGTCVASRGTPCASTVDCGVDEYCDGSFCKPQVLEGECCNIQDDLCAEGLSCQLNSGTAPTCQP